MMNRFFRSKKAWEETKYATGKMGVFSKLHTPDETTFFWAWLSKKRSI